jgi:hypothetical protein
MPALQEVESPADMVLIALETCRIGWRSDEE